MVKHQAGGGGGGGGQCTFCYQLGKLINTPGPYIHVLYTKKVYMHVYIIIGVELLGHVICSPVPGAVHGLEGIYFFLHFKLEHVFL